MRQDIPDDWDEDRLIETDTRGVDFDVDPLTIHEEGEDTPDDDEVDDVAPPDPDIANLIVEFVDVVNARDMDSLAELLAPDAEATFLGGMSQAGVVTGLEELIFRYPDLVLTRGDLGSTPIAAVWILDADTDHYRFVGMFTVDLSDDYEGTIGRLDYVEEPPEDDLVVEVPEDSERSEWDEWATLEEN
jgi:hypothetical protein